MPSPVSPAPGLSGVVRQIWSISAQVDVVAGAGNSFAQVAAALPGVVNASKLFLSFSGWLPVGGSGPALVDYTTTYFLQPHYTYCRIVGNQVSFGVDDYHQRKQLTARSWTAYAQVVEFY